MTSDRNAPLSANINDYCFIDDETRAIVEDEIAGDITNTSTGRYAESSKVIVITYAIGDGEVKDWWLKDFDGRLNWDDAPYDLASFRRDAVLGRKFFVAFNSAFDRCTINKGIDYKFSPDKIMHIEMMLDASVQAAAANLPGTLDAAAKACGHDGKQTDGKKLIKLFCVHGGATPQSHPEEWGRFLSYARMDIEATRLVWKSTLPLPFFIWREFWAAEHVNDRGLPMDREFLEAAAKLAAEYTETVNARVAEISGGALRTAKQHKAIASWVYDRVEEIPDGRSTMVKRYVEDDEGGELIPAQIGLDRNRTARLMALIDRVNDEMGLSDEENDVRLLLIEKEYGGSTTPGKFQKALDAMSDDDRLTHQYVFAGAQQTGRFSSRGVQMHNMTNKALKKEREVLNAILDGCSLEMLEELAENAGLALSRVIRPAIMADDGKHLVWGDWSNIEARVLPWLAGAEERLEVFRLVDADPSNPDVYVISAAGMDKKNVKEVWAAYKDEENPEHRVAKNMRQKGKIAELSLGFGGGVGALLNMAANYGMAFTEAEAAPIVKAWRESNPWCTQFWKDVWSAFIAAANNPGRPYAAGRVVYIGIPDYLGTVTVQCYLPDGRPLTYRNVKFEKRTIIDKLTGEETVKEQWTFAGGYGRKGLWHGVLVENITQATAACLLRDTITRIEYEYDHAELMLDGHTHDEIVGECDDTPEAIAHARKVMLDEMVDNPDWAEGLPLAAEISDHPYYSKAVD